MSAAMAATWLLPPLAPMLLVLVGLWLISSKPRAGRMLIGGGAGVMIVLSIPWVGSSLLRALEPPFVDPATQTADAIVILGGGSYAEAPEYGRDTVNSATLERLRYGVVLYRRTHKPVLVTGGNPHRYTTPEAQQMRAVLEQEWQVPVKWTDDTSDNTADNARNSFAILNTAGITRIYLVTHAWHMPRARRAFEHAGFVVVAAPTRYAMRHDRRIEDFVPSTDGFLLSAHFCREALGAIWYRLKPF